MKQVHLIVLIILGFLLSPGTSYACGSHHHAAAVPSYSAAHHGAVSAHSCDVGLKDSESCSRHGAGHCDGPSCSCAFHCIGKFLPLQLHEPLWFFIAPDSKTVVFGYGEPSFEVGRSGLRLPPKIG